MKVAEGKRLNIGQFPNFHRSGSIRGMKNSTMARTAFWYAVMRSDKL